MERIASLANLESVVITGRMVTIQGWFGSINHGAVGGFAVAISGTDAPLVSCEFGLPSPDVKQVHPQVFSAECCRVLIRVHIPNSVAKSSLQDLPLVLTPLFADGLGLPVWSILNKSIPDPPVPFKSFVGGGDAWSTALEFLGYFVKYAGLKPTDHVLDVGCGYGRMASVLLNHLQGEGSYDGFDIEPALIHWAQQEISGRAPNFRFQHAPIFNTFYNPRGTVAAGDYAFPFDDATFDFFILTSVFTHMPAKDVRHYLDEIRRVLKPGGRGLISCFLLNDESSALVAAGNGLDISHPYPNCTESFTLNPVCPDHAVGFREPEINEWVNSRSMNIRTTMYGSWCHRPRFVSYQDLLIIQG